MADLIVTEHEARTVIQVLTDALDTHPPAHLCTHHAGTMRHWRRTHGHETPEGYLGRCADIARQCCVRRTT